MLWVRGKNVNFGALWFPDISDQSKQCWGWRESRAGTRGLGLQTAVSWLTLVPPSRAPDRMAMLSALASRLCVLLLQGRQFQGHVPCGAQLVALTYHPPNVREHRYVPGSGGRKQSQPCWGRKRQPGPRQAEQDRREKHSSRQRGQLPRAPGTGHRTRDSAMTCLRGL